MTPLQVVLPVQPLLTPRFSAFFTSALFTSALFASALFTSAFFTTSALRHHLLHPPHQLLSSVPPNPFTKHFGCTSCPKWVGPVYNCFQKGTCVAAPLATKVSLIFSPP